MRALIILLAAIASSVSAEAATLCTMPDGKKYAGDNPPPDCVVNSRVETNSAEPNDGEKNTAGAWQACQGYVRDELRNPSTAQFPPDFERFVKYTGGGHYNVESYVDIAKDAADAGRIRVDFSCTVADSGTGWTLITRRMRQEGQEWRTFH